MKTNPKGLGRGKVKKHEEKNQTQESLTLGMAGTLVTKNEDELGRKHRN